MQHQPLKRLRWDCESKNLTDNAKKKKDIFIIVVSSDNTLPKWKTNDPLRSRFCITITIAFLSRGNVE